MTRSQRVRAVRKALSDAGVPVFHIRGHHAELCGIIWILCARIAKDNNLTPRGVFYAAHDKAKRFVAGGHEIWDTHHKHQRRKGLPEKFQAKSEGE